MYMVSGDSVRMSVRSSTCTVYSRANVEISGLVFMISKFQTIRCRQAFFSSADNAGSRKLVVITEHSSKFFVSGKGGLMIHLPGNMPPRHMTLGQCHF
jgi:hypothetical protein